MLDSSSNTDELLFPLMGNPNFSIVSIISLDYRSDLDEITRRMAAILISFYASNGSEAHAHTENVELFTNTLMGLPELVDFLQFDELSILH